MYTSILNLTCTNKHLLTYMHATMALKVFTCVCIRLYLHSHTQIKTYWNDYIYSRIPTNTYWHEYMRSWLSRYIHRYGSLLKKTPKSQLMIYFFRSLLPRSVEKRPWRLNLCNNGSQGIYIHIYMYTYIYMYTSVLNLMQTNTYWLVHIPTGSQGICT